MEPESKSGAAQGARAGSLGVHQRTYRLGALSLTLLACCRIFGCFPAPVAEGRPPEELAREAARLQECIVLVPEGRGQIVGYDESGRHRELRPPWRSRAAADDTGVIYGLSPVNESGEFAAVLSYSADRSHALTLLSLAGGEERTVLRREGFPFGILVGKHLSLSADGSRLAFLADSEMQWRRSTPNAVETGPLAIVDVHSGEVQETGHAVIDGPLHWAAEDARLFAATIVDLEDLPGSLRSLAQRPPWEAAADYSVPAVGWFDTDDWEFHPVGIGERCLGLVDGEAVISSWPNGTVVCFGLEGSVGRSHTLPGFLYPGAIGLAPPDTVLYWAEPEPGQEVRYSPYGAWGKTRLIDVARFDLSAGELSGRLRWMDPRADVRPIRWAGSAGDGAR
jgi:hypothetical protein